MAMSFDAYNIQETILQFVDKSFYNNDDKVMNFDLVVSGKNERKPYLRCHFIFVKTGSQATYLSFYACTVSQKEPKLLRMKPTTGNRSSMPFDAFKQYHEDVRNFLSSHDIPASEACCGFGMRLIDDFDNPRELSNIFDNEYRFEFIYSNSDDPKIPEGYLNIKIHKN